MKKLLRFIPAFIIMAVIFFFSAQDADSSTQLSDSVVSITAGEENVGEHRLTVIVRKCAHLLEYAALGAALYFGFRGITSNRAFLSAILALLSGTAYAVTDEIHQYFVPGRACMAADVIIDGNGVALGVVIMVNIIILWQKYGKNQ